MPERKTIERARKDKREGKAPSTQAGEFVREEMEHIREGKHGARSSKQAIAIGLSKARRAFESPIAIACLVERAPCLPSRMCSISSRTNSPACVVGALPSRRSCSARSTVAFSGIALTP